MTRLGQANGCEDGREGVWMTDSHAEYSYFFFFPFFRCTTIVSMGQQWKFVPRLYSTCLHLCCLCRKPSFKALDIVSRQVRKMRDFHLPGEPPEDQLTKTSAVALAYSQSALSATTSETLPPCRYLAFFRLARTPC